VNSFKYDSILTEIQISSPYIVVIMSVANGKPFLKIFEH